MGMRFELMLINFRDLEDSIALTTQPTHQYNYISIPLYHVVPFKISKGLNHLGIGRFVHFANDFSPL